ncbi:MULTISPECIES: pyridoxine/pyridoxamine 5'-phosphate oxidase [Amycolatopsis]|uniref:Pyridoxal 5'-phosphate synthase n=1 Tax=Amycolatopsis dendrobii TaxID=2760662 RepID=A0A7W3ZD72_9PSEU|nr:MULTISPECIES: pyridoxal 5'-phosphate synthase [Amycolatopsis]MBB1156584.1 pyridoxal 5'-phosphate synthase [Amycolatopsis dendrobii]UKD53298.1 pyridoxal 5'-phosphate synthase [Amycolatopsis sp. FU40]
MVSLRGWQSFPEQLPEFDPDHTPETPEELFLAWLTEAGEHVLAPHAVTLSTVDADGAPDARVVILKNVDEDGWAVATSSESPKGQQLAANPRAALTFFWPGRGRQVRVRGLVVPAAPEVSADDFLARPPASRAEAYVGHQSEVLSDPEKLVEAAAAAADWVAENPDVAPETWTRYLIQPESVEFWQASHDRRHLRVRYRREPAGWVRERLWP